MLENEDNNKGNGRERKTNGEIKRDCEREKDKKMKRGRKIERDTKREKEKRSKDMVRE